VTPVVHTPAEWINILPNGQGHPGQEFGNREWGIVEGSQTAFLNDSPFSIPHSR
jgi:hypothetical protein